MLQYEYGLNMNIAECPWMSENAWIMLDIWQSFEHEYASGMKYARFLNMLQYSYGNIIIVANIIMLEFFSVRFVHPGALQLTILSFFNMS